MPRFARMAGWSGTERGALAAVNSVDTETFMRSHERQPNPRRAHQARGRAHPCSTALRTCLMLLALAGGAAGLAGGAVAQVKLPDFGDAAEATLSPADEQALGEAFMREIRARLTLVDDPLVVEYVQSLGYRLVASSDRRDLAFTFFVVADDSLNAFAAPGGFVGVNSGIILATESESEFASVLAHEIAHVTQRHIVRAIDHASRSNLPVLAGILAAVIIGAQDIEAGQAAAAAVIGTTAQRQINFTRQNEMEADRVGIRILADAGFDPQKMAGVFEKLQEAARYSARLPGYLSTHPVTTDRIAEARDRAERLPYRQHASSESYFLVRAKLRAATAEDAQRVLDQFREERSTGHAQSPTANSYGQAVAMTRLGRDDDAREVLELLLESHPDNLTFRADLAASVLRSGDLPRALALYTEGLDLYPNDRGLVRGHATALNEADRPDDAVKLIDEFGQWNAIDSEMYRLRADANQKLGRRLESRADLAEHHYLSGRLGQAIEQLQLARQVPEKDADFYAITRIEARLEELETEARQRAVRR